MPNFECRGVARLTLPALFTITPGGGFAFRAQSDAPVKVLLTPQNRATYLSAGGTVINAQTQASLPLSTGQALNEVEPLSGFVFPPFPIEAVDLVAASAANGMELSPETVGTLMAQLDASGIELDTVNAALNASGVSLSLARESAVAVRPRQTAETT